MSNRVHGSMPSSPLGWARGVRPVALGTVPQRRPQPSAGPSPVTSPRPVTFPCIWIFNAAGGLTLALATLRMRNSSGPYPVLAKRLGHDNLKEYCNHSRVGFGFNDRTYRICRMQMLVFYVAVSFVPGDCSDQTTGSPCRCRLRWKPLSVLSSFVRMGMQHGAKDASMRARELSVFSPRLTLLSICSNPLAGQPAGRHLLSSEPAFSLAS